MDEERCPFCHTECHVSSAQGISGYFVNCPNCGRFILTTEAGNLIKNRYQNTEYLLAGYLYETNINKINTLIINERQLEEVLTSPIVPKTLMQRIEKLLIFCHKSESIVGERHGLAINSPRSLYMQSDKEYVGCIEKLYELGYVNLSNGILKSPIGDAVFGHVRKQCNKI